jgi:hypothetical protein
MKFNVAVATFHLSSGARRKAIDEQAVIREPPSAGARQISSDMQSIRNAAMVRPWRLYRRDPLAVNR